MKIVLIAAVAKNNVIGAGKRLPWRIPDEMMFFRSVITNRWHINNHRLCPNGSIAYIAGRKTFESMPSMSNMYVVGRHHHPSIDCAMERCKSYDTVFILGGSSIYAECIERQLCHRLIISRIHASYEGDIHMPPINTSLYKLESTFAFSPLFNIEQWVKIEN